MLNSAYQDLCKCSVLTAMYVLGLWQSTRIILQVQEMYRCGWLNHRCAMMTVWDLDYCTFPLR